MPREIDERKKRAALRKLRLAAALAAEGKGPPLSEWERQFLDEVEARIETYGSAFADPSKGEDGAALSGLQTVKLREINKKASGKAPSRFGKRSEARPLRDDGATDAAPASEPPSAPANRPTLVARDPAPGIEGARVRPPKRPALRVIQGGAKKTEG